MASCECCWADAATQAMYHGGPAIDYYDEALERHAFRGCPCAGDSLEGRKMYAGQFWDEEKQMDRRDIGDD